jgi:hypothetical protein
MTTNEILEDNSLTLNSNPDFNEVMDVISLFIEAEEPRWQRRVFEHPRRSLLAWSGIEVLDYENYIVNIRGNDFSTLMEAYKTIYSHSVLTAPQDLDWRDSYAEKLLLDQQILFSFISNPTFLRTYATVSTDARDKQSSRNSRISCRYKK